VCAKLGVVCARCVAVFLLAAHVCWRTGALIITDRITPVEALNRGPLPGRWAPGRGN
jgi:hypothetical protein